MSADEEGEGGLSEGAIVADAAPVSGDELAAQSADRFSRGGDEGDGASDGEASGEENEQTQPQQLVEQRARPMDAADSDLVDVIDAPPGTVRAQHRDAQLACLAPLCSAQRCRAAEPLPVLLFAGPVRRTFVQPFQIFQSSPHPLRHAASPHAPMAVRSPRRLRTTAAAAAAARWRRARTRHRPSRSRLRNHRRCGLRSAARSAGAPSALSCEGSVRLCSAWSDAAWRARAFDLRKRLPRPSCQVAKLPSCQARRLVCASMVGVQWIVRADGHLGSALMAKPSCAWLGWRAACPLRQELGLCLRWHARMLRSPFRRVTVRCARLRAQCNRCMFRMQSVQDLRSKVCQSEKKKQKKGRLALISPEGEGADWPAPSLPQAPKSMHRRSARACRRLRRRPNDTRLATARARTIRPDWRGQRRARTGCCGATCCGSRWRRRESGLNAALKVIHDDGEPRSRKRLLQAREAVQRAWRRNRLWRPHPPRPHLVLSRLSRLSRRQRAALARSRRARAFGVARVRQPISKRLRARREVRGHGRTRGFDKRTVRSLTGDCLTGDCLTGDGGQRRAGRSASARKLRSARSNADSAVTGRNRRRLSAETPRAASHARTTDRGAVRVLAAGRARRRRSNGGRARSNISLAEPRRLSTSAGWLRATAPGLGHARAPARARDAEINAPSHRRA